MSGLSATEGGRSCTCIIRQHPRRSSLLLLKEVEGHSVEELAQMTGMNENTIKVKLFRSRQKLVKAAQRLTRGIGQSKT